MWFTPFFLIAHLISSSPDAAACDRDHEETRITEAIVDGIDQVWIFSGDGAATFMKSLDDAGLMVGVKSHIDKVYVTEYGMIYHVFFLDGGCIIGAYDFYRPLLEGKLP
jgi:hypothetical protein